MTDVNNNSGANATNCRAGNPDDFNHQPYYVEEKLIAIKDLLKIIVIHFKLVKITNKSK